MCTPVWFLITMHFLLQNLTTRPLQKEVTQESTMADFTPRETNTQKYETPFTWGKYVQNKNKQKQYWCDGDVFFIDT